MIENLLIGFQSAITLQNLLACVAGVIAGTVVGVLPGLGPFTAVAILLPFTYYLDPSTAIIALAGIFYGTQYGGSITSILLNLPGESASVVTTLDGYQMTKNGNGSTALAVSAIGSFFAGIIGTILLAVFAIPLSAIALKFGSIEYAYLMISGIVAATLLSTNRYLVSIASVLSGMLIGFVGIDIHTGIERFTGGVIVLYDGIPFVIIAIGMFGLAEVLYDWLCCSPHKIKNVNVSASITKEQLVKASPAIARGTAIGSILGVLPGIGAVLASFVSYAVEKRISKTPERFVKGAIEGVAAPESANNAGAQTGFIPLLSIGIPTTPVMAIILSVLVMHNIQPGPQVISSNPELFWGLVVSMLIGNVILLVLNLPLVGIWVKIIAIPRSVLYPAIIVISLAGVIVVAESWEIVALLVPFVIAGFFLRLGGINPTPFALGAVVSPLLEENVRRAVIVYPNWQDWIFTPAFACFVSVVLLLVYTSSKTHKYERML